MGWSAADTRLLVRALSFVALAAPFLPWMSGKYQTATSLLMLAAALLALSKKTVRDCYLLDTRLLTAGFG